MNEYAGREFTAAGWFRWFGEKLNEKINSKDPRFPRGRKAGDDYQTELSRLSRFIGNRIVVNCIAPVLGERVKAAMAGRLRNRDDY